MSTLRDQIQTIKGNAVRASQEVNPTLVLKTLLDVERYIEDGHTYRLIQDRQQYRAEADNGVELGAVTTSLHGAIDWLLKRALGDSYKVRSTPVLKQADGRFGFYADCPFCIEGCSYRAQTNVAGVWTGFEWKGCSHFATVFIDETQPTKVRKAFFIAHSDDAIYCDKCENFTTNHNECIRCGNDPIDYRGPDCRGDA